MMCLQALAPPSCRICLPSVFQANFHSPFKAWSCFSSRSFREPPLRTKSPGDNASFLFACCSIESQFTVTSCLPLRSLMLHWNSLGQWFCLLSVGILSYAGLSYSQGGNRRCGVDSKQSFCISSHSQLQVFWFHFKTVISPNSLRNPKRCLTCIHGTVLPAAPWKVPPCFCPPLAPPCRLRLTTLVPEEGDETCPPGSQSSCALSL